MREQEIVFDVIADLRDALPGVSVRTRGGDAPASPPVCIIGWRAVRLRRMNGANAFGSVTRDAETGAATGRELHRYYRMEVDVAVRAYDEGDRDGWLSDVADAFLPYEYDADSFDPDTTEWEVGTATPRSNSVIEPDWYEGGLDVSFVYVTRVDQSADALTGVDRSLSVDEGLGDN